MRKQCAPGALPFFAHTGDEASSVGDNYAHARTVDTRLFFSLPTKSLGTRLVYQYKLNTLGVE